MKICLKCGSRQPDSQYFCPDCGEPLGKSVSEEEAEQVEEVFKPGYKEPEDKFDPLYVCPFDKILGIISCVGIPASILLSFFKNDGRTFLVAICFAINAIFVFFPHLLWTLRQFEMSFFARGGEDEEPTFLYFLYRKAPIYIFFALAILCIVLTIVIPIP